MLKFGIILSALAVCHVQGVYQYLYTLTNQDVPVNVSNADGYLPHEFNPEDNTIILIHGQGGGVSHEFNTLIMREIFQFHGSHNIIVFDWEREASESYSTAVANVPVVANVLSRFLTWLSDSTKEPALEPRESRVDLRHVHLVGFGLGAHIAGIASRQLRLTHGIVGRISGLDPSGRNWGSSSQRLRPTDAHYVEVLHTDGVGPTANGIGTQLGHIDFFANGGNNQPGCFSHSCSHDRAYELFAAVYASMRGHLLGVPCRSLTQLNFGICRGNTLELGGLSLSKPSYDTIYNVNTEKRFPF